MAKMFWLNFSNHNYSMPNVVENIHPYTNTMFISISIQRQKLATNMARRRINVKKCRFVRTGTTHKRKTLCRVLYIDVKLFAISECLRQNVSAKYISAATLKNWKIWFYIIFSIDFSENVDACGLNLRLKIVIENWTALLPALFNLIRPGFLGVKYPDSTTR